MSQPTGQYSLHSKLRILEVLNKNILILPTQLRVWWRKYRHKDYYLIKSIPGIGGILFYCRGTGLSLEAWEVLIINDSFLIISVLFPAFIKVMKLSNQLTRVAEVCSLVIFEVTRAALRRNLEMQTYYRKYISKNPKAVIVKVHIKWLWICFRLMSE